MVVYSSSVNPELPQLNLAREHGKEVYSEFALAKSLCRKPIIAVCGSQGRTTVAHMIGFTLKMDGKNVFVGGTNSTPFIEFAMMPDHDSIDFVVVEVSALQLRQLKDFSPNLVVFTNLSEDYPKEHFQSIGDYIETSLSIVKTLSPSDTLVVSFDRLANNTFLETLTAKPIGTLESHLSAWSGHEVQGTHFHDRRIHSNIMYHSEFSVGKMRNYWRQ